jgi:hypothetical protein
MFSKALYFVASSLLGLYFVYLFYSNAFYPFESVDLTYYIDNINFYLSKNTLNTYFVLFLFGLLFSTIYHQLSRVIQTGKILRSLIVTLIVFLLYIGILVLLLGTSRLDYMKIYLLQDMLALLIFYLTISIMYRRNKIGD